MWIILAKFKMYFYAGIGFVLLLLGSFAYMMKIKAERAEWKLKSTEQKLNEANRANKLAKERVKKHEARQQIEDDVYSASESHINDGLRKYYRD